MRLESAIADRKIDRITDNQTRMTFLAMPDPKPEEPIFTENLRAPGWMFAFLGLVLGAASGMLTAIGIRQLTGDPLISGSEALVFYLCFGIGVVGIVYVMLGSTLMRTVANSDGLTVSLGVLGTQRTFAWSEIKEIRATNHNIARHGGRGNPFAPSSRKSWTMYGVRSGVEIEVGGATMFISSRNGNEFVAAAIGMLSR